MGPGEVIILNWLLLWMVFAAFIACGVMGLLIYLEDK